MSPSPPGPRVVGEARIADFDPGTGTGSGVTRPDYDDAGWLPVDLPTDVQSALTRAGRIPDPFVDANESRSAWVAQREWWFRCVIPGTGPTAADERLRLVLPGVDTVASVWVNGTHVGRHASMFRPADLDVTGLLHAERDNVVAIGFPPLVDAATDVGDVTVRDRVRSRYRKMQVGFGWDISCYLLTVGLWEAPELRREDRAAIRAPVFETVSIDRGAERAVVRLGADVEAWSASQEPLELTYRLTAPDGRVLAEEPVPGERDGRRTSYLVVDRPDLWWTHDLGRPHLHRLDLVLRSGGEVLDSRALEVGIRTVELDQSPDLAEHGSRFFRFVLNGVPLFARGANWVPESLALAGVSRSVYRERIAQAAGASMNMLRVWGGGTYEKDHFYEACDRAGILVWQDFMFAGLPYPNDDDAFLGEAEAEAVHQVRRLRSHPSLALWCGNNEAVMEGPGGPGRRLFGEVLPSVVADEDGRTAYWPGSPYGGNGFSSTYDGDTHDWRGFHGTHASTFGSEGWQDPTGAGRHWRQYAEDVGRFVSEFGFAAAATLPTIEHWNSPSERQPGAHAWQDRIRYVPGDSHVPLLEAVTGVPRDARQWVDYTQLIQAEGFRFGIERFRERKPHCSGALIWQLNDCWPGFTWSVIDFDGRPKPAYFAVRRAFSPTLATVRPLRGGAFELWAVNDSADPVDDTLTLEIRRFDGSVLRRDRFPLRLAPHSPAQLLRRFGWGRVTQPRSCYVHVASERGTVPDVRQLFADLRELELPAAEVTVERRPVDDHTVDVHLAASSFVVMAAVEDPGLRLRCSDNYVTLDAEAGLTLRVSHPDLALDPGDLTVRSLFGPVTVRER